MLTTMRSSWLLFALLALVALSAAFSVEDALHIDGINAYLHHGEKRQAQGTGVSSSADAPSSSAEAPSSTADTPSSSAAAPSSSAAAPSTSAPATSEDTPSSAAQTSRQTSSANVAETTSDAAASQTSTKASASLTTKKVVSTEVAPTTTVITLVTDGQTSLQTSIGSITLEHTSSTVETSLPTTGASTSSSGGLSSTNKSIIGGVVGGVGGAILLGGIALVCWRMWGKKKRVTEDDADLMAGTGSALGDKSHSSASPFQANLEQYHNPGGRPNAAANF